MYDLWMITDNGPSAFMTVEMVTNEVHELSAILTEHPVEEGQNVTDHIRRVPDCVTLEVFVSNTPLQDQRGSIENITLSYPKIPGPPLLSPGGLFGAVGGAVRDILGSAASAPNATVLTFPAPFDNVADILTKLRFVLDTGARVQLYTPHWAYDSMVLTDLKKNRAPDDGDGARLTLSFKQIRIVTSKTVKAPVPLEVRAKKSIAKGGQTPTPTKQSVYAKAFDSLGGVLPGP